MNAYEKLIKTMRSEGSRSNTPLPKLGIMTSKTTCKVGSIELDEDDLLVAEHLTKPIKIWKESQSYGCGSIQEGDTSITLEDDPEQRLTALKKDDVVLLVKVNDSTYVIIEKVVSV